MTHVKNVIRLPKRSLLVRECWAVGIVCLLAGCPSNDGNGNPLPNGQANVIGSVKDVAGRRIANAHVACGGVATTTNNEGMFYLDLPVGPEHIVVVSCAGYVTAGVRVDVNETGSSYLPVTLMPMAEPQSLNASDGGVVTGARNASITVPPGAFVNASGRPVTGNVDVRLTPFDPATAAELAAYPGELRGLTLTGETLPLVTYGVLDITVTQNGQPLQIAQGQTITVQVPAPSKGDKPDTSEVWIFDAATSLWVQSEHGDAIYDPQTDSYIATIGHLSPCNIDRPIVPTCIWGLVKDAQGNPVAGAFVQAIPESAGRISSDYTDMYGYFCMYVERNTDMRIEVWTPISDSCPSAMRNDSYCVTTRSIHSGSGLAAGGYPADCSANCTQVPVITTEDVDPGPIDEAACVVASIADNPFWNTCASGLGDFYACYAPQGACFYEIDPFNPFGAGFVLEFENGSKMESEFSIFQGPVIRVYGPTAKGNPLCGTITGNDSETTITTASGSSYTISVSESGRMEMTCSGGFSFVLTPQQVEFLSGCNGSSSDDGSGVACKAKPGTLGAACTFDLDCTTPGLTCCGPIGGEQTCQIATFCDLLCDSDLDCEFPSICCSAGGYNMCMPAQACQ